MSARGLQRLISNHTQGIGALSSSATAQASAISRTAVSRTGNGRIALTGPYTGSQDATVDVEILDSGTTQRITIASFQGVGTGEMADLDVTAGTAAQTFTVTCVDAGTPAEQASLALGGVSLLAAGAGVPGNSIEITVDESGLTVTPSDYTLLVDLTEGTEDTEDPGADFGGPFGAADVVPDNAKRIRIGGDTENIYTYWQSIDNGVVKSHFSPPLARAYTAGARIAEVAGSRSVTITDGVSPEVYSSIVTLADLLTAIESGSDLVAVGGVIDVGRSRANTQGTTDLRLRTGARVVDTYGEGTEAAEPGFINTSVGTNASTERVEARCIAAKAEEGGGLGREKWSLKGSVSGELGVIETAEAYTHPDGKFALTVPTRLPAGYDEIPRGSITAEVAYVGRSGDTEPPPVCVDELRVGPDAREGSIRFVYTKRPTGECDCRDTAWERLPAAAACLDPSIAEEVDDVSLDTEYQSRLEDLYQVRSDLYENISPDACAATNVNTDLIDAVIACFASALAEIYSSSAARTEWDAALTELDTDAEDYAGVTQALSTSAAVNTWQASTPYAASSVVVPTTRNGRIYRAVNAGTSDASEPTWPTSSVGATVTDNDIVWEYYRQYWSASTATSLGTLFLHANGYWYEATTAGTTGSTEPDFPTLCGATLSDGTVVWTRRPTTADSGQTAEDAVVTRWCARMDYVRTLAGVVPSFSLASTGISGSSPCWRDPGNAYWWVPEDDIHLPAFTNVQYVGARLAADGSGTIVGTHDFAFVIKVACPSALEEGDSVTINIGNVGGGTYQLDDRLYLITKAAGALPLSGGVDADTDQTWSVKGSTDGNLSDYVLDVDSPALYSSGGVEFRINPGGIAFAEGDRFTFGVEIGQFRYRVDAGSWSSAINITDTSIGDGLTIEFEEGAAPSFVAGDSASFSVEQPYSAANALVPDDEVHAWSGTGATLTAVCSGTVDAICIARHTIPSAATINVQDGASLNENIPWAAGPIVLLLDTALADPTLTITISGATDGEIGWLWAGEAVQFELPASAQRRRVVHRMVRGSGINPAAVRRGRGYGWGASFNGWLRQDDVDAIEAAIDYAKDGGDLPVVWVPQQDIPAESSLVRLPDEIELTDTYNYWNSTTDVRRLRLELELEPWLTS